ncbi:rhomboid family intramembrane serine protease [Methanolobus sediminis]|uniref:Rhomboid family intramembrane serine protease n=1 Tax=Methanolobus sediminis TaxID=3072978 RepID=A0AA51YNB0_9EURY|nr:rhomboid family intramembrane serine protease [Methanolobus sediminis]WMW26458.1 rhomboid family intramembrane serine protease [Methanolobus sediminis]
MNYLDKKCWICGKEEAIPFKCRFCGKTFCSRHRLPEQHACDGLEQMKKDGYFSSGNSGYGTNSTDDIFKDALKDTAKYAAKSAVKGVGNNIKYSMKNSPAMAIIYLCIFSFILQIIPGYKESMWLIPNLLFQGKHLWTLVTHMFVHSGFTHLLFNMLVLFFFGPEFERRAGKKIFIYVYFTAGLVAAIAYSITTFSSNTQYVPVVGASGAIMGIFAALAIIAPDIRVYVYFIPMQITHALILFILLDFFLLGSNDMVAHTAHLSGALVGVLMGSRIKRAQIRYNYDNMNYRYRR